MKKLKTFSCIAAALCGLAACAPQQAEKSTAYTIEGCVVDSSANGKMAYLSRNDNRKVLDSVRVENNRFTFTGQIDSSAYCLVFVTPREYANFILEPGQIEIHTKNRKQPATGTKLNEELSRFMTMQDSLIFASFKKRSDLSEQYPDEREMLKHWNPYYYGEMVPLMGQRAKEMMALHRDDLVGYCLLTSMLYQSLNLDDQQAVMEMASPSLLAMDKVAELRTALEAQLKTKVGQPFADVKGVDRNGKPVALADFVGKGKYVLVDFWASWCVPCMHEMKNLAKLQQKFGDGKLTIVGVNTYDKMDKFHESLKKEKITWNQIMDQENKAMASYGVSGIPFIFLLSPEGEILARDLRGENMLVTVENFLNKK